MRPSLSSTNRGKWWLEDYQVQAANARQNDQLFKLFVQFSFILLELRGGGKHSGRDNGRVAAGSKKISIC